MTREDIRKKTQALVWGQSLPADSCRADLYGEVLSAITNGRGEVGAILAAYAVTHLASELTKRTALPESAEVSVKGKMRAARTAKL
jgi:hypothetical protein